MRRKYLIIIPIILLACLGGVLVFSKSRITFYEDSYKRNYTYSGVFDTITADYNGCKYNFETNIVDEKEATTLVKAFDKSRMQIIKSSDKVTQEKLNIYVLADDRIVGPVIEADALFLPKKYLYEYDYRYWFVQLMLKKGLCKESFDEYKNIFKEETAEQPMLFSTKGFTKVQQETVDNTELFIDGNNDYIFKSAGSEFIINSNLIDDSTYEKLIDLIQVEAITKENLKKLLADINIDQSMYGGDVDNITYHIENKGGRSYTSTDSNGKIDITLNDLSVRTTEHELMHGFFVDYTDLNKYWIEEGFCEYVAYILYPDNKLVDGTIKMSVDDSYEDGDFMRYLQSKNYDDNDIVRLYFDYVVNRLYQGKDVSDYPKLKDKINTNFGPGEKTKYYGANLSYTEAMSFTAYLIDLNGLDGLFDFMSSEKPYEEFFGKTYYELEEDWKQTIKEKGTNHEA